MTEFSPLGYVASLLILALVVSYAVLLQASAVVREQSRLLFMVPFALLLWITGKLLGLGAWMGKCIAWLLYSLTELWGPRPVAGFLKSIVDSMDLYRRRQLVPARHAA